MATFASSLSGITGSLGSFFSWLFTNNLISLLFPSDIIGYCLCHSGEPITLLSSSILVNVVTELCKVSSQTVIFVVAAPIGTSLVESVGSFIACPLPGSLTSGLFLIPFVSHDFLCRKCLYRRRALHDISLIMLNETYSFDLITVAL
jgi:hypothetical protein